MSGKWAPFCRGARGREKQKPKKPSHQSTPSLSLTPLQTPKAKHGEEKKQRAGLSRPLALSFAGLTSHYPSDSEPVTHENYYVSPAGFQIPGSTTTHPFESQSDARPRVLGSRSSFRFHFCDIVIISGAHSESISAFALCCIPNLLASARTRSRSIIVRDRKSVV